MLNLKLNGGSYANGKLLGSLAGPVLRQRYKLTRTWMRDSGVSASIMKARVADFTRLLSEVAPHWLDEASGLAAGSGVEVDAILGWNCLPRPPRPDAGNNCTSFIRVGAERNLAFKIRDERNRTQIFAISSLPRGGTVQIGVDVGNLGAAHILTSDGLSGMNNTGGVIEVYDGPPRLNDCHLLRLIAEKTAEAAGAPKIFDELAEAGATGTASTERGCMLMFTDFERAVLLETALEKREITEITAGRLVISNHFISDEARSWETRLPNSNTLTRRKRMTELLDRIEGEPIPPEIFAVSRCRKNTPNSLCNDDSKHFWMTISAQLHVLERRSPESSVNYACCGNTRCSPYVPIAIGESDNARELLSGEYYEAANALYLAGGAGKPAPREILDLEKSETSPSGSAKSWKAGLAVLRKLA